MKLEVKRAGRRALLALAAGAWLALAGANAAQAELRPYRAEYSLRLGTAANATRVGKAVQDVTLECDGWHFRRDVRAEVALTPSLQIKVLLRTSGEEDRAGDMLSYRSLLSVNGAERKTEGEVRRDGEALRATVETPEGIDRSVLPGGTLLPVAAIASLVDRLAAGDTSFPLSMFTPDGAGKAIEFEVRKAEADTLQATPPAEKRIAVPAERSWPVAVTILRVGGQEQKPPISVRAQVFDNGVIDRLAIDAGVVTVTAYLRALEMHDVPACAKP
ncbi:EipB family protein [Reyranella sp.]|uniref:EipB family protein n=1 Tax=Reyranella sp. TaxID=1929291 RepID=UPI003BAAB069